MGWRYPLTFLLMFLNGCAVDPLIVPPKERLAGVQGDHVVAPTSTAPLAESRLSDADLFAMLNLSGPGLTEAGAALAAGDSAGAKSRIAAYFRTRQAPVWFLEGIPDTDSDRVRRMGKRVINRSFTRVGVTLTFGPGKPIDWFANPTGGDTGIEFQPEWTWQLNRHQEWDWLGAAYRATGEERYAVEFADQLASWIAQCPRPLDSDGDVPGSAWRTIETGIRAAGSWPRSFYAFRASPSVSDDLLLDFLKLFAEHALHLLPAEHFWSGSNWGTMESNGLFTVGVLFPEFKEAATWRDTAAQRLFDELDKQVYPDGMQIELSTGYHQVSLRNFYQALQLARLNDVPMPGAYLERLERMFAFNVYAAQPDGYLPPTNDSGNTNVRQYSGVGASFFPERDDFRWSATHGREGTAPSATSHAFPYSGFLVMRSSWEPDAMYMMFDVGPLGYGHQHEDKLSFVAYAYGRPLVVDPGNYPYDRSKWRRHVTSAYGHNTIVVDGKGQHRRGSGPRWSFVVKEPLPHIWVTTGTFDYAEGYYDEGFGPEREPLAKHTRSILFVKPERRGPGPPPHDGPPTGYWLVRDVLEPTDAERHSYEALFHLNAEPDETEIIRSSRAVATRSPSAGNVMILPAEGPNVESRVIAGQEEPVLRGWKRGGHTVVPLPVASFTFEGVGPLTRFWLILPLEQGTITSPVRSFSVDESGSGAVIRWATGAETHIAFPPVGTASGPGLIGTVWTPGQQFARIIGHQRSGSIPWSQTSPMDQTPHRMAHPMKWTRALIEARRPPPFLAREQAPDASNTSAVRTGICLVGPRSATS